MQPAPTLAGGLSAPREPGSAAGLLGTTALLRGRRPDQITVVHRRRAALEPAGYTRRARRRARSRRWRRTGASSSTRWARGSHGVTLSSSRPMWRRGARAGRTRSGDVQAGTPTAAQTSISSLRRGRHRRVPDRGHHLRRAAGRGRLPALRRRDRAADHRHDRGRGVQRPGGRDPSHQRSRTWCRTAGSQGGNPSRSPSSRGSRSRSTWSSSAGSAAIPRAAISSSASASRAARRPSPTSTSARIAAPTAKNAMTDRIAFRLEPVDRDRPREDQRAEDPGELLEDAEEPEELARLVLRDHAGEERPAQRLRAALHHAHQPRQDVEVRRGAS